MESFWIKYYSNYLTILGPNSKYKDIIILKKKHIAKANKRNQMKRKARFLLKCIKSSFPEYNYNIIITDFNDIKLKEYEKIKNHIVKCIQKKFK